MANIGWWLTEVARDIKGHGRLYCCAFDVGALSAVLPFVILSRMYDDFLIITCVSLAGLAMMKIDGDRQTDSSPVRRD